MLVGILSDTHGRADATAAAVELLRRHKAEFFIHCGDVGSASVLDQLVGLRAAFVWGNCDFDRMSLSRYAQRLGISCFGAMGELALDGKSAAIMHGDDHALKRRLLSEQRFDYLLQGHTHRREDLKIGRTRLVNPGALHRAAEKTVALLDTSSDHVEFLNIIEASQIGGAR